MTRRLAFARVASWTLMATGLGWIGYLLATTVTDPSRFIPDSVAWLLIATLLVAASVCMNVVLFYLFLNLGARGGYPLGLVVRLQLAGQILRYLPGRLWGVAYQIGAARGTIPAIRIARANTDWMGFSLIASSVVALTLIGAQRGWPSWALLLISMSGLSVLGALFLGGANWLIRLSAGIFPERVRRILHALAEAEAGLARFGQILAVFLMSWVLYIFGWSLLARVFPAFTAVDFVTLCANYTLASVIGIASAITPAGLGVREAAFVMLAMDTAGQDVVAFFAVFGRIWLMAIDLALFTASIAVPGAHKGTDR